MEPLIIGNSTRVILPKDWAGAARRAALRGNRSQQQARMGRRLAEEWKREREIRWAEIERQAMESCR